MDSWNPPINVALASGLYAAMAASEAAGITSKLSCRDLAEPGCGSMLEVQATSDWHSCSSDPLIRPRSRASQVLIGFYSKVRANL